MSKETEKVRRWRERMKAEGKQAITLWLNRDAIERLNTLAAEAKITVSEFIERAVTVTQPKVADTTAKVTEKVTDTVTDNTAKVTDTVAVIRELVREEVERALYQVPKPGVTVTTPLKVQKYNIENQWLETSLDDLPHSQVRRSIESDRGESGSYVESPSGHL
jgi:hypothetical protein